MPESSPGLVVESPARKVFVDVSADAIVHYVRRERGDHKGRPYIILTSARIRSVRIIE